MVQTSLMGFRRAIHLTAVMGMEARLVHSHTRHDFAALNLRLDRGKYVLCCLSIGGYKRLNGGVEAV